MVHCFSSLVNNKQALKKLSICESAHENSLIDTNQLRHHLQSDIFWAQTEGYLELVKPVADAILAVEGDERSLSIAAKIFTELEQTIKNTVSSSPALKSEEKAIKEIIPRRRTFLLRKVHFAANLLDPRYRGEHLSKEEEVSITSSRVTTNHIFSHQLIICNDIICFKVAT